MIEIIVKILLFLIIVTGSVFYYIKTKNAKHSTFRLIIGIVLLTMVMSYLIKGNIIGSYGDTSSQYAPIAFADTIANMLTSINVSLSTILYLVAIGIFYAVLNKAGIYESVVEYTASVYKKNKGIFLIISVLSLGLVTAFTGQLLVTIVFVPFLISVIRKLGYSKEVSITATIGAILLGHAGSFYNLYLNSYLNLGVKDNVLTKVVIVAIGLVSLLAFLIVFNKRAEKVELKESYEGYSFAKKIILLAGTGLSVLSVIIFGIVLGMSIGYVIAGILFAVTLLLAIILSFIGDTKTLLVNVFMYLMFILLVLGFVPWADYFGYNGFTEFLTSMREFKVADIALFDAIVGSEKSVSAFGTWQIHSAGLLTLLVSAIIYSISCFGSKRTLKVSDIPSVVICGIKKSLPYVCILLVANLILVNVFTSGTMNTIIDFLTKNGINLFNGALVSVLAGVFYPDSMYASQFAVIPLLYSQIDGKTATLFALLLQSVYSIALFVSPTSILLLGGLYFTKTSYKEWIKHIWLYVIVILLTNLVIVKIVPFGIVVDGDVDLGAILAIALLIIAVGLICWFKLVKTSTRKKVSDSFSEKEEVEVKVKKVETKKQPAKKTTTKKTTTKKSTTKSKK